MFVLLQTGASTHNRSVRDMFGKHERAFDVNVVAASRCGGGGGGGGDDPIFVQTFYYHLSAGADDIITEGTKN